MDTRLLRRLNLNHLLSFVMIAEMASFRGAARQMNVSQSALSVHIRKLEEELGFPLFQRTTRSVALTAPGDEFLTVARRGLQELSAAARRLQVQAVSGRAVVRVTSVPFIVAAIIPSLHGSGDEIQPPIDMQLTVFDTSRQVAEMVAGGAADLGLLYSHPHHVSYGSLEFSELFEDPYCAVVSNIDQRFAGLDSISLAELASFQFLLQPSSSFLRQVLDTYCEREDIHLEIRHEVPSVEGLVALAGAGLGVTVIPSGTLTFLNHSGCRLIPMTGMRPSLIGLVTQRQTSASVIALRDFILSRTSSVPPLIRKR